jgi:hypothetical protein
VSLSPEREASLRAAVRRDLSPRASVAWLKSTVAVALGGAVSLLACGQFGVGHTVYAEAYSQWMHATFGGFWCVAACGVHFAVLPALVLRLLAGGLQFRAILRDYPYIPMTCMVVAGAYLSAVGQYWNGFVWLALWAVAAATTFYALTSVMTGRVRELLAKPSRIA